jgi:spermidine synthase
MTPGCPGTSFLERILAAEHSEKPFVVEHDGTVSLHFELSVVQSRMCLDAPDDLVLGYTRAMMGFLLFRPEPDRVCMIGLGGGSLVKFCYRQLPKVRLDVVEIRDDVIALRDYFMIPKDDERLQILHGDGANHIAQSSERYDAILVDGFNEHGQAQSLCTSVFYQQCFDALTDGGVMAVNLTAGDRMSALLIERMRRVFNEQIAVVRVPQTWNIVVFAIKGREVRRLGRSLFDRAEVLKQVLLLDLGQLAALITAFFLTGTWHNDSLPAD